MSCGRGIYWDVRDGLLVSLQHSHFPNGYAVAVHVNKRANQGYPDAIVAMLEADKDVFLQEVVNEAKIKWRRT